MKIGIMTFWCSNDNYGQLLQCYALQKYLRDRGHDAFLIRYNWEKDVRKNPFILRCLKALNPRLLVRFLLWKKHKSDIKKEQAENDRHFDDFRSRYILQSKLEYPTYKALCQNPPEADAYIVGSDQVWNFTNYPFKRILGKIHAYMLDFGKDDALRVSYAASWSVTSLSESLIREITPLLKRFDYVSVREKNGINLCSKCGKNDSEWVCDPTLLLDKEEYQNLYADLSHEYFPKKFIFLYVLNNSCDFDIQKVIAFAKKQNLEVIYTTGNGVINKYKKKYATIEEWLWFIENADYVITNSFHCCIFSLIFHKRFGVIKLTQNHSRMNVRLESLWEQFQIAPRYISDSDFSVLKKDYVIGKKIEFPKRLQELLNAKK